ncbi:hypothetical protein [Mesorhizobium huakuii]|uniref:Uncharacterized protein n=1 Tax=Mesorhizobium huakuii TaxID=28104 RepID=A0A7G6STM4_9HYPH|nr:hypothetical protein [Mesorhizobium huakuii]QND57856.1 hypothetical protein HB778_15555 [Mesorhizobium huakuii]
METTILLLLIGFGAGFYFRGLRAKTEAANSKRHADALDQQISILLRDIVTMSAWCLRQSEGTKPPGGGFPLEGTQTSTVRNNVRPSGIGTGESQAARQACGTFSHASK